LKITDISDKGELRPIGSMQIKQEQSKSTPNNAAAAAYRQRVSPL
jgi:hypothetical protein